MENSYNLSDIAAVTGGEGFGGTNSWVLIILFALIFGWGGTGFGGRGGFEQYATAASQQEILFGQQFQGLDNKIDRIGNGIADATFALNNSIKDGNAAVAGRVVDEGRALQMQLAECCCGQKEATAQVRYDMANFASAISENTTAQAQKILDALAQNKIDALQAQVSELKTQNMFCGIPRINPYGYGVYPYANTGCGCSGNNF